MGFRQRDQIAERNRYDLRATLQLNSLENSYESVETLSTLDEIHIKPYLDYYALIRGKIENHSDVLELGCGMGLHSSVLFEKRANVTLLDISSKSLEICRIRFGEKAKYLCSDMTQIDLKDSSFDLIVANGVLSYASHRSAVTEMHRLLRPGGTIIIMDSLNHNPIFILNRLLHYFRGERTFSTLIRTPRVHTLRRISRNFESTQRWSYGSYIWIAPILKHFISSQKISRFIYSIESKRDFSRYRFKFLLICENFVKN